MQQQAKSGHEVPALQGRPDLHEDLADVWQAYMLLARQRQYFEGGIPGAIPISELMAYLDLYAVDDPDTRDEYLRIISAIDEYHIELLLERRKKLVKEK